MTPVAMTMAANMAPAPTNGSDHEGNPAKPESSGSLLPASSRGTKPMVVVTRRVVVVVVGSSVVVVRAIVVVVVVVKVVVVGGKVVVVDVVVVVRRVVAVRRVVVVVGGRVVVVGTVVLVVSTWACASGWGAINHGTTARAMAEMARMRRRRRVVAVTKPLREQVFPLPHECSGLQ
jgi:hypothetical protein